MACHIRWWSGASGSPGHTTSALAKRLANRAIFCRIQNCIVCNENAEEAVIVEGIACKLTDGKIPQQAFTDYKAKYGWELDPKLGPVFEVRLRVAFALPEKQFPKGVTRWKFE